jgi:hypothetical protein
MSIDWELSESKFQGSIGGGSKKGGAIENLMRKKIEELNESGDFDDSNDY